eukprot:112177_1
MELAAFFQFTLLISFAVYSLYYLMNDASQWTEYQLIQDRNEWHSAMEYRRDHELNTTSFPFYIFQIGFNKAATRTLAHLFEQNDIHSFHNKENGVVLRGSMTKRYKKNEPLLMDFSDTYRYYGDFASYRLWQHTDAYLWQLFVTQYPHSKYILNIRNVNHWLKSRYLHYSFRRGCFIVDCDKGNNDTDMDAIRKMKQLQFLGTIRVFCESLMLDKSDEIRDIVLLLSCLCFMLFGVVLFA